MNGQVEALKLLVRVDRDTAWLLTDKGVPVLHLCVHHNQFEALKVLVEVVDSDEFVNLTDDLNNTILHLLAAKNQYEVIKFLLSRNRPIVMNVVNVDGMTALDVSRETNPSGSDERAVKIKAIMKAFGAKKARKISPRWLQERAENTQDEEYRNWLSKMKESLMVVAALMASISFQAVMNPPGGVWQEDGFHNSTICNDTGSPPEQIPHIAGRAVISYTHPSYYRAITFSTGLGLLTSLSLILLLVSGFHLGYDDHHVDSSRVYNVDLSFFLRLFNVA